MEEISSKEQIEAMETEEIEQRVDDIFAKYLTVTKGKFVPREVLGDIIIPAGITPTITDYSRLSEAEDLPPFTFELILAFLWEINDRFTSGEIEEKYNLKYYEVLAALAKSRKSSEEILHVIAGEMEYLSGEGCEVDMRKYSVAMLLLRHENCSSEIIDRLVDFAFYCRANNFDVGLDFGDEDVVTLIVENPQTSIETLAGIRQREIEKWGEQADAEEEEDPEEIDLCDESIVQAIDRVLKSRGVEIRQKEVSQQYDDPKQLKLF